MRLGSLSVGGFRSFRQPQTVHLDGSPGLVYVTGVNAAEPELGANGVGKSTLFEALHWVLFGKTSRNLRASEVANWTNAVDCRVELQLDGRTLVRTWQPNTLKVEGEEITQQQLVDLLGLSEDAFLHAVYHAQFVSHFADRGPTAQLEIFSDVLRLQVWEEAAERANTVAKKHAAQLAEVRERAAGLAGEWRRVVQELEALEQKESDWWRIHVARQRQRWLEMQEAKDNLERAKQDDDPCAGVDRALEKSLRAAEEEQSERNAYIRGVQTTLKRLEDLQGECPTCCQPIDQRYVGKHRKEIRQMLVRLGADQTKTAKRVSKLRKACEQSSRALRDQRDAQRVQLGKLLGQLQAATVSCEAGARDDCPYDTSRLREELAALEEKLRSARQNEGEAAWTIQAHEFWVKAFREIRLSIVEQALVQFESTTNNALASLGLVDWSIEYDVQSETKGGRLSKGFVIYVHSPHNESPVPFTAWSGGESQRLRLAISLGLSDVIQDFCGAHSNVEIFDEPTNWLSGEGLTHLLQVLAERARERRIRIFLADHKALEYAFDSTVVVTKDSGGSRITEGE